jgi:hypothetical protein
MVETDAEQGNAVPADIGGTRRCNEGSSKVPPEIHLSLPPSYQYSGRRSARGSGQPGQQVRSGLAVAVGEDFPQGRYLAGWHMRQLSFGDRLIPCSVVPGAQAKKLHCTYSLDWCAELPRAGRPSRQYLGYGNELARPFRRVAIVTDTRERA